MVSLSLKEQKLQDYSYQGNTIRYLIDKFKEKNGKSIFLDECRNDHLDEIETDDFFLKKAKWKKAELGYNVSVLNPEATREEDPEKVIINVINVGDLLNLNMTLSKFIATALRC